MERGAQISGTGHRIWLEQKESAKLKKLDFVGVLIVLDRRSTDLDL
jgi:hypothetical protein